MYFLDGIAGGQQGAAKVTKDLFRNSKKSISGVSVLDIT